MRPLRSLMIGDVDHYFSPYMFGVQQAMARLGHWHSQVNIRQGIDIIQRRICDVKPDILWTHMLLWAPLGSPAVQQLVELCQTEARRGCKVIIHDGDYKEQPRYAQDISSWCALALCNHKFDRSVWRTPVLYWPYFGFAQDEIATPEERWKCQLFFAGTLQNEAIYSARTQLVRDIGARVQMKVPTIEDGNTLFRTPEIAASADAVLGFGRPGVSAWIDTRVFQYPSAGAILLHDDVQGFLEPWKHFVPYASGSSDSIVEALGKLRAMPDWERRQMRESAFSYVQEKHSSVARARQVIDFLFGGSK